MGKSSEGENLVKVKPILASVVLCGALIVGMTGCASAGRSIKTFSSELGGGLQREVIVYDATGQEIFHQTGKFDIEENEAGTKVFSMMMKTVCVTSSFWEAVRLSSMRSIECED